MPVERSIPTLELDLFLFTVDVAIDLALSRRVEDGYRQLENGLQLAIDAMEAGEPWGPELAGR